MMLLNCWQGFRILGGKATGVNNGSWYNTEQQHNASMYLQIKTVFWQKYIEQYGARDEYHI